MPRTWYRPAWTNLYDLRLNVKVTKPVILQKKIAEKQKKKSLKLVSVPRGTEESVHGDISVTVVNGS